jgi:predicted DNA-binding transcriptional regulator AlpA
MSSRTEQSATKVETNTVTGRLLDKQEVANYLGVNKYTIDRWRRELPDFPEPIWLSGTSCRWRLQDIEKWLATRPSGGKAPEWNRATIRTKDKRRVRIAHKRSK